jgi:DNA uptake protein ComE-like DNA-binding protein
MPKKIPYYLVFTKEQRNGIMMLFCLVIFLQLLYYFYDFSPNLESNHKKAQWLSLQNQMDSLKQSLPEKNYEIRPFNPNFISDFKGYQLGMSLDEIDRLLAFRRQNKFVNSAEEFQRVTKVSDSLLQSIKPYFKFPDWVNKKQKIQESKWIDYSKVKVNAKENVNILDINSATKEDLMSVYGIGDALSDRILKQKEHFGAFVSMSQIKDVWGLTSEVVEKINTQFKVIKTPNVKKININNATIKELGQFPYFRYPISKNIVTYRSMNGDIKIENLVKIKDFPIDKIEIIALYLEF